MHISCAADDIGHKQHRPADVEELACTLQIRSAAEHEACVVCLDAEVQVLFRPCMHAVACQASSALLAASS